LGGLSPRKPPPRSDGTAFYTGDIQREADSGYLLFMGQVQNEI